MSGIASIHVEGERAPCKQELILLRTVEDRVRVLRRLVHVPGGGNDRREHQCDSRRPRRAPISSRSAIAERRGHEDDGRHGDHPQRPCPNELACPKEQAQRHGDSLHEYARARTIRASTSSAPAVISISERLGMEHRTRLRGRWEKCEESRPAQAMSRAFRGHNVRASNRTRTAVRRSRQRVDVAARGGPDHGDRALARGSPRARRGPCIPEACSTRRRRSAGSAAMIDDPRA